MKAKVVFTARSLSSEDIFLNAKLNKFEMFSRVGHLQRLELVGTSATVVERHAAQLRPLFQMQAIMQDDLNLSHTSDLAGTASQDSLVDGLTPAQSSDQRSTRESTNNGVGSARTWYASSGILPPCSPFKSLSWRNVTRVVAPDWLHATQMLSISMTHNLALCAPAIHALSVRNSPRQNPCNAQIWCDIGDQWGYYSATPGDLTSTCNPRWLVLFALVCAVSTDLAGAFSCRKCRPIREPETEHTQHTIGLWRGGSDGLMRFPT
jgi:hypothetical protein